MSTTSRAVVIADRGTRAIAPLAATLLISLAVAAGAQQPEPADTLSPEARVDRLMSDFDRATPGAVVAVVEGGEVVFSRGYGMANLTHGVPFTPRTATNIGSTAKQFTGFALAILADRGELSLDDDVRSHVPELPDFGETVTLRHLLTHTSGYREFLNTLALAGRLILDGDHVGTDEILEILERQPELQNSPGTEFNYNNTGYGLAALVVERVSGRTFPEWMAGEVFGPIGMRHTVVRADPGVIVPNAAAGYRPEGNDGYRELRDLGGAMGAGGIYTTVGDLALWMRNLATGEHGGRAVVDALTTPFELESGESTGYGLGLFLDEARGLARWQHGGGDTAHRSHFYYYPDLDAGYVVLSNAADFPATIPAEVAEAFFGDRMTAREADTAAPAPVDPGAVDVATLDAYVGAFELDAAPGFVLTIRRAGEGLEGQATGQGAVPLAATSDSTFVIVGVPNASLTFHRDDDGSVDRLTLHQNGAHTARRVTEEPGEIDLATYVGRYFSEELETFYTLEIGEDDLVLRHRRFGPVVLRHSTGERFTGGFPVATVEFERDDAGSVSGLVVGNGRARDIRFERTD